MLHGPLCKTEGCTQLAKYRLMELCNVCYQRLRSHGTTTKVDKPSANKHPRSTWGHNIDRLREQRGVKVRDLCKATGIDTNTYSRMLRPDGVNLKFYIWIAEFFGVELSTLFEPVSVTDETCGS